jgi:preprotein translocase subunit SecE
MSATDASQQANRAGMDPKRLVVVSYLVFGLVIALFVGHLLEQVAARFGVPNSRVLEGLDWKLTDVAGVVLTAGAGFFCWFNPKVRTESLDVANELMRVTWPSWEETRLSTYAVVVASLVAAGVLFGIDQFAYRLMIEWLPILWGKL